MKNIILYFLIFCGLFSCKKQELEGDLAYLEGKWKLHASINSFSGTVTYTTSMAFDEKDMHYLEFEKSGRIKLYNYENKIIERGRIISYSSMSSTLYPGGIRFEVKIGTNALFNKTLNKIDVILLISTSNQPLEFITNDIIYDSDETVDLVFQKM